MGLHSEFDITDKEWALSRFKSKIDITYNPKMTCLKVVKLVTVSDEMPRRKVSKSKFGVVYYVCLRKVIVVSVDFFANV